MASLQSLIDKMRESDEGEPLSDKEYHELIGDIRFKVDAIKEFISSQEMEAKRLEADYIKPIQARKKQIENSVKNLKKWVISVMDFNKYPFIKGELFTIKLTERESLECDDFTISNLFYIKNKDFVKKEYSIHKKPLFEKIKNGESFAYARKINTRNIKFTVNKKGK